MDVYTLPVPGSGGKTCSQIFEEAGCDTPASPSCGACLGGPKDTYARMNEAQASIFFSCKINWTFVFFFFKNDPHKTNLRNSWSFCDKCSIVGHFVI